MENSIGAFICRMLESIERYLRICGIDVESDITHIIDKIRNKMKENKHD